MTIPLRLELLFQFAHFCVCRNSLCVRFFGQKRNDENRELLAGDDLPCVSDAFLGVVQFLQQPQKWFPILFCADNLIQHEAHYLAHFALYDVFLFFPRVNMDDEKKEKFAERIRSNFNAVCGYLLRHKAHTLIHGETAEVLVPRRIATEWFFTLGTHRHHFFADRIINEAKTFCKKRFASVLPSDDLSDADFLMLVSQNRDIVSDPCCICRLDGDEHKGVTCGCGHTELAVFRPCGHCVCIKPCFIDLCAHAGITFDHKKIQTADGQVFYIMGKPDISCATGFSCPLCRTTVEKTLDFNDVYFDAFSEYEEGQGLISKCIIRELYGL